MKPRQWLNVLVAEDNEADLALLREAVRRNSMDVRLREVSEGPEVIRYLCGDGPFADRHAFPMPDVLLLDLKMPKLSGFDVLHWLREHPECSRLPAIIISGSGLEKDIEKAYALGANTYFEKPSDFADFTSLLELLVQYWARSKRPHHVHNC
jgi:CheY-like chemotaxis protein